MTDEHTTSETGTSDIVVELQQELRPELKEPFGPIHSDTDALLAAAGTPLIAVGDIVTYHLIQAGCTPDVALIDGRTKRAAVDDHIEEAIDGDAFDCEVTVENPPATLSAALLYALRDALDRTSTGKTTVIVVDGEEDLAAVPAIAAAPDGASVVYGQPDAGMVLVDCTNDVRERVRDLISQMHGDPDRLRSILAIHR